ncbi:hypothetical protein ACIRPH_28730 [Nocardiopsis sp. NPDC101807]|uniref:hypothetical protein n=1 Tax=Nocardiopsis sp. NPDC101807 TaxID=3364339 RepID=UPI00382E8F30
MGESDVAKAYVYVAKTARKNLETGIKQSVWGWKADTVNEGDNHNVLASLKKGDYLYLGFRGSGHISAPKAQSSVISKVVVTRLTGGLYEDTSKVWEDDVYPYRVPLELVETMYDVTSEDIGEEGVEALRGSACGKGAAFLPESRESVMEKVLAKVLEDHKAGLTELEDPADSVNRDLPSVLDLRSYVLTRAEQKMLRQDKLDGRTQVHCDLCQLLLPARLVHTAHIRRRSESPRRVRLDPNNLMFACVLGCDSLFEHGYVYVAADGAICSAEKSEKDPALAVAVGRLGATCTAHTDESAAYFAWHRHNIAHVIDS